MTPAERTAELGRIMDARNLTCRQVGELLKRELRTVRNWRSRSGGAIPEHALEVLRAKAGEASEGSA